MAKKSVNLHEGSNPRCVTPVISSILSNGKDEPSPYVDPAYDLPTCQREKLIPNEQTKKIRCATPFMDQVFKEEAEYDRLISEGLSPEEVVRVLDGRRAK